MNCWTMRKQKSPCTLSSYASLSEWQISSTGSCNYENESLYSTPPWPEFIPVDSSQTSNAHENSPQFDYCAAGDMPPQNFWNRDDSNITADDSYVTYDYSWIPTASFPFSGQSVDGSYANNYVLPPDYGSHYFANESFRQSFLQYGMPTVTDYGSIALLLRHLIRVELIADGSVSVYNFPAVSVATLNASGSKCFVEHPNGRVFQEGSVIHMMAGKNRLVKISRRGVTFSGALQSLAYLVDESGTKTTTSKFTDISNDLTLDVFYDGNQQTVQDLERECLMTVTEGTYQSCLDGGEVWELGKIRVSQDRWGQVTVTQNSSQTTITTSPTIRKMTVESPSASINIGCYSKNFFSVRKNSCVVTSGFCGLIVQNGCQKAGLDRNGRLVLF